MTLRPADSDGLPCDQLHRIEADGDIAPDAQQTPALDADNTAANMTAVAKDGEAADIDVFLNHEVEGIATAWRAKTKRFGSVEAGPLFRPGSSAASRSWLPPRRTAPEAAARRPHSA